MKIRSTIYEVRFTKDDLRSTIYEGRFYAFDFAQDDTRIVNRAS